MSRAKLITVLCVAVLVPSTVFAVSQMRTRQKLEQLRVRMAAALDERIELRKQEDAAEALCPSYRSMLHWWVLAEAGQQHRHDVYRMYFATAPWPGEEWDRLSPALEGTWRAEMPDWSAGWWLETENGSACEVRPANRSRPNAAELSLPMKCSDSQHCASNANSVESSLQRAFSELKVARSPRSEPMLKPTAHLQIGAGPQREVSLSFEPSTAASRAGSN